MRYFGSYTYVGVDLTFEIFQGAIYTMKFKNYWFSWYNLAQSKIIFMEGKWISPQYFSAKLEENVINLTSLLPLHTWH